MDYWKDVPGIDDPTDESPKKDLLMESASIHTNPDIEKKLRKAGFDIPKYPKQGDVTYNGKVVGRMDNFNGLMIKSKSALAAIKKAIPKVGIWNEGQALEEKKRLLQERSWADIYDEARENILDMFESVEDGIRDKKLFDKWDKAQRKWIESDKLIQEVLKKY